MNRVAPWMRARATLQVADVLRTQPSAFGQVFLRQSCCHAVATEQVGKRDGMRDGHLAHLSLGVSATCALEASEESGGRSEGGTQA